VLGVGPSDTVPAFARGVVVGGLKFRYAYSININGNSGMTCQDFLTIHSALVVLPMVESGAFNVPSVPNSGFLFSNMTTKDLSTNASWRHPRMLWRSMDKLTLNGGNNLGGMGERLAAMDSTALHRTPELIEVKSKARLNLEQGLYFVTEIVYGCTWTPSTGQAPSVALDWYGVTPVKPIR